MDIRQIERLMRTMQQHGVTSLELTEGETRLCLTRTEQTIQEVVRMEPVMPREEAPAEPQATGKEILAPMVGTFHPSRKNPVKVGSKLKKGDVLCVVEAMKLMNDIVMEEDGEITFIALQDGDMVEYGQVLALYR